MLSEAVGSSCLTFWLMQDMERSRFSSNRTEEVKLMIMLTEIKTWRPNPVDQCVYFFLLSVSVRANETHRLSVGAGQQSKRWCGCMCAECCLILWLWHRALQHVSVVLHLDFFRSNLGLFVQVVDLCCMSTYSINPPDVYVCIYHKHL